MRQISVLIAHAVFALLFFWNTFKFMRLDDQLGLYVNLVAALLAVISGLVYYLLSRKKKQDQAPEA